MLIFVNYIMISILYLSSYIKNFFKRLSILPFILGFLNLESKILLKYLFYHNPGVDTKNFSVNKVKFKLDKNEITVTATDKILVNESKFNVTLKD